MKRIRTYLYLLVGFTFASVLIGARGYYQPTRIEDIDSMLYCACGYSKVKFDSGRIVMVHYHHDDVKPGDQIGTYRTDGNTVELDTVFGANKHHEKLKIDHIGIIEPPAPMQMFDYRAINSTSWKLPIYKTLKAIGLK